MVAGAGERLCINIGHYSMNTIRGKAAYARKCSRGKMVYTAKYLLGAMILT